MKKKSWCLTDSWPDGFTVNAALLQVITLQVSLLELGGSGYLHSCPAEMGLRVRKQSLVLSSETRGLLNDIILIWCRDEQSLPCPSSLKSYGWGAILVGNVIIEIQAGWGSTPRSKCPEHRVTWVLAPASRRTYTWAHFQDQGMLLCLWVHPTWSRVHVGVPCQNQLAEP